MRNEEFGYLAVGLHCGSYAVEGLINKLRKIIVMLCWQEETVQRC